jgi:hypothetical protein
MHRAICAEERDHGHAMQRDNCYPVPRGHTAVHVGNSYSHRDASLWPMTLHIARGRLSWHVNGRFIAICKSQ